MKARGDMLTFILLRNKCKQVKWKNMTDLCEGLRSIGLCHVMSMETTHIRKAFGVQ